MTPTQIIALVRDVLIIGALAFLVLRIYDAGQDSIKSQDVKAVVAEIKSNAAKEEAWRNQSDQANAERSKEIASLTDSINSNHRPIIVQSPAQPSSANVVPSTAAPAHGADPAGGSVDAGSGRDIRPDIDQFEIKYETALAGCRAALASWPQ